MLNDCVIEITKSFKTVYDFLLDSNHLKSMV